MKGIIMNCPSIKTIMDRLSGHGMSIEKAKLIRTIMQTDDSYLLDAWKQSREFLRQQNRDYNYIHSNTIMEAKMMALDEILEGYGTEVIRSSNKFINHYYQDIIATYINMGESYATTIILMHENHQFIISSWGDLVESLQRKGYKFD
jgi:hypothetical protein